MEEMLNGDLVKHLCQETRSLSIKETLEFLTKKFGKKVSFSTSFGVEDQVITDMIFTGDYDVKVFTLDTGRHFEETYKVHNRTLDHFKRKIQVYHPDKDKVENLLTDKGPFSFYESLENRVECCSIRKVEPLKRALKDESIWITGIRSQQSENRKDLERFGFDTTHGLIKYNPLINWSLEEVEKYIRDHHVPYNVLHDQNYVSIGCAPCSRAIRDGQDFRAGRWWWENNTSKECGLHAHKKDTK